jgi:hypothetical protein
MVFASHSLKFYRDSTTLGRLWGLSHLDNFIVIRKFCPLKATLPARPTPVGQAKTHANHDTDGNSPYHLAVIFNPSCKADDGKVIGLKDGKKLMEDIPNKVKDILGILVDVNLHKSKKGEFIEITIESYPSPFNY